ncbi:MAG: cytochrome c oxidase subunit II [Ktedonobacterales bacterium]|nr:cytochrome c oxidase subunit II [Ktedonobacterales bacterium]
MPFLSHGRSPDRPGFQPRTARRVGAALLLMSATAIAGCGTSKTPDILNAKGPIAAKEAWLFWLILIIATIVFVLVTGALLYSIIRFRARPDSPAPRQLAGNTKLEIAWTIVPSVVLFIVLVATIATMLGLAQPTNKQALRVTAIGHQWWWEFQYPDLSIVTADELHIPAGQVVQIDLRSDNVIHSFWVPQLGGKTDVIPGHNNSMWLQADAPGGPYRGECAEFCGTQHANMDFTVIVDSASTFQTWVANQQLPAAPPTQQQLTQGARLFAQGQCVGCHQINGVNKLATVIGPNLTHFGSRILIAGGVLENTRDNLRNWIANAQTVKNGSDMPSFGSTYSSSDLDALVAYLESLK